MTENKRFRKVMGFIQDNACEGGDVEGVMDLTEIEDMLNSLNDENQHIKNTIKEAITIERTDLGRSVLKQLAENLEIL